MHWHFPTDLCKRVNREVSEKGFCLFSQDDLAELFSEVEISTDIRIEALHQFARNCGAQVETTPHLTVARFTSPSAPAEG